MVYEINANYSLSKIQSKKTIFEDLLLGINTVDEITFVYFNKTLWDFENIHLNFDIIL